MKRLLPIGTVLLLLFAPRSVLAQIDLGQGDWVSGKNVILGKLLARSVEQVTHLSNILENVRMGAKMTNEVASLARSAYRQYEVVKNYSWEDLLRDVEQGFRNEYWEITEIESEIGEIKRQYDHRDRFFKYWGRHDWQAEKFTLAVIDSIYEEHVFKHLRSKEKKERDRRLRNKGKVSPLYKELMRLWVDSGLLGQKLDNEENTINAKLTADLLKEASESKRKDVIAAASTAASNHEIMVQVKELKELMAAQVVLERKIKRKRNALRATVRDEVIYWSDTIFAPTFWLTPIEEIKQKGKN